MYSCNSQTFQTQNELETYGKILVNHTYTHNNIFTFQFTFYTQPYLRRKFYCSLQADFIL